MHNALFIEGLQMHYSCFLPWLDYFAVCLVFQICLSFIWIIPNSINIVFFLKLLWFFWTGVCTHTDTEGKQRKARVRNNLKSSKNTIFSENPVWKFWNDQRTYFFNVQLNKVNLYIHLSISIYNIIYIYIYLFVP